MLAALAPWLALPLALAPGAALTGVGALGSLPGRPWPREHRLRTGLVLEAVGAPLVLAAFLLSVFRQAGVEAPLSRSWSCSASRRSSSASRARASVSCCG